MTLFTKKQILFILSKINDGNPGYSDDEFICALQSELSILLQKYRNNLMQLNIAMDKPDLKLLDCLLNIDKTIGKND